MYYKTDIHVWRYLVQYYHVLGLGEQIRRAEERPRGYIGAAEKACVRCAVECSSRMKIIIVIIIIITNILAFYCFTLS